MQTILTKTLTKGNRIGETLTVSYDKPWLAVHIGDESLGKGQVCELQTPQGDVTHYINNNKPVGLTTAEAEQIEATVHDIYINDPRNQRNEIVDRMQDALHQESYHSNRDDDGTGLRFRDAARYHKLYESCQAELAAFDAAHPELVAELKAEAEKHNAEMIESAMRQ